MGHAGSLVISHQEQSSLRLLSSTFAGQLHTSTRGAISGIIAHAALCHRITLNWHRPAYSRVMWTCFVTPRFSRAEISDSSGLLALASKRPLSGGGALRFLPQALGRIDRPVTGDLLLNLCEARYRSRGSGRLAAGMPCGLWWWCRLQPSTLSAHSPCVAGLGSSHCAVESLR